MGKDREFNDVLDECLERLLRSGESIEQCLESYPKERADLEPLLRTGADVRKATRVEPGAEFKARARYQFHRALAQLNSKRPLWQRLWEWEWRPRLVTAATVILVILFTASSMGIATYQSMPGQVLHPVRLTAEEIWLARTPPGIARAQMHARLAERRVAEIMHLAIREDKSAKVEQVAQRLYYHLALIESLAAAEMVVARVHVVEEVRLLAELDAPDVEMDAPEAEVVVERVAEEIGPPGPAGPAGAPGTAVVFIPTTQAVAEDAAKWAQFKAVLEQQAADHLTALRGLLPVVSETARPALLTAIAVVEAGYERAIEGLE
jgi:hypothetical protein